MPLTKETLSALLEVERPRFEACLAPTASRLEALAGANLTVVASGPGARVSVTPRGLSPAAVACLEATGAGLNATATQEVEASLSVATPAGSTEPGAGVVPDAELLRQRVTSACPCFAAIGVNAPPQLVITARPQAPLDVLTTSDLIADRLERCLEETVAPLEGTLEVTLDLPLLNGDAHQPSPDASADVALLQDAAMARRHSAALQLALARRRALEQQLKPVATSLKRKPTPALVKQRAALCRALVEVDDEATRRARLAAEAITRAKGPASSMPKVTLEPVQACAAITPRDDE
jgi:hypothetical protein